MFCLFKPYLRPWSAHAGHIMTGGSLLTGHDALLLRQIVKDLYMHYHIDIWMAFGEPVVGTGGDKLIAY